jgi:hypothetical protein
MAFQFRLAHDDGTPAEPPTLNAAVPNWRPGDTIALGRERMLRVVGEAIGEAEPCLVALPDSLFDDEHGNRRREYDRAMVPRGSARRPSYVRPTRSCLRRALPSRTSVTSRSTPSSPTRSVTVAYSFPRARRLAYRFVPEISLHGPSTSTRRCGGGGGNGCRIVSLRSSIICSSSASLTRRCVASINSVPSS